MAVDANDGRTLEQRLRLIEAPVEIYNLIASHPPSADTGAGDYTASVWTEIAHFAGQRSATPVCETGSCRLSQNERDLAVFTDCCGIEARQRHSEQPHTPRWREVGLKKIEAELLNERP